MDYIMNGEKIKPDRIKFDSLVNEIKGGRLKIPDFQRDFVWDKSQVIKLLDSIYQHYPIGSFLFWETNQELTHRNIGNIPIDSTYSGDVNYVLDGQQRITSLFASVENAEIKIKVNGQVKNKQLDIYFDLDTEEFKSMSGEDEEDLIDEEGRKYLSLKEIIFPSRLILTKLNDKRGEVFDKVSNAFKNYEFSVIYVKNQPIDVVCQIFERINNSGQILNVVDLMVAKTWSKSFNLKERLHLFQKELKEQKYDGINDITLLQVISTNVKGGCHRKDILSLTREEIEKNWKESMEAIKRSIDFLKTNLNIGSSKILPFPSMLVPISYFFYNIKGKSENEAQIQELINWFWKAAVSNRFSSSVEGKIVEDTKQINNIIDNKEVKFNFLIPQVTVERIIQQKYSLGNAFCKTLLCILAAKKPKNIFNNSEIVFNNFAKFNAKEYHHIFPQEHIRANHNELNGLKDSIANIMFMPSGTNKNVGKKSPKEYLSLIENNSINNTLKTHLIDNLNETGIEEDNFEQFLNYRATKIVEEIKGLVGDFTSIEKEMASNEEKLIDSFEKNMRSLIVKTLGNGFYNSSISQELRERVEERIELHLNKNPSEKREELNPIDFFTIMQYFKTIRTNWDKFEVFFKSKSDLEKHFVHINDFRNAIRHSRDVNLTTKKLAEGSLIWFEDIFKSIN